MPDRLHIRERIQTTGGFQIWDYLIFFLIFFVFLIIEWEGRCENLFLICDTVKRMYLKGMKNGSGRYFWKEHVVNYVGTYANNNKESYGIMKYPDGSIYDGFFIRSLCLVIFFSFFLSFFLFWTILISHRHVPRRQGS
jgi:hypothetical protein